MSRRYVVFAVALRRIPVRALSFRESVVASFSLGPFPSSGPLRLYRIVVGASLSLGSGSHRFDLAYPVIVYIR